MINKIKGFLVVLGVRATSFPGSLGKTLVSAGHVPHPKFNARGGVV